MEEERPRMRSFATACSVTWWSNINARNSLFPSRMRKFYIKMESFCFISAHLIAFERFHHLSAFITFQKTSLNLDNLQFMIRFQSLIFTGPNFGPVSFVVSTCILLKFAKHSPQLPKVDKTKTCAWQKHLSKLGEIESSNFFRLLHLPLESLDLHLMSREFQNSFIINCEIISFTLIYALRPVGCQLALASFLDFSYPRPIKNLNDEAITWELSL